MIFTRKNIGLVMYLAALAMFAPFSTDIYLASMPTIQHLFKTSTTCIQLTLSLFFISFAVMQLLWGPLSDRIGRKPVILIGLCVFVLASLLCAFSQNILLLIIARIIQAAGACAGIVMAMAIVKDYFSDPKEISRILRIIMSVAILAPMVAPIIGSYLLYYINWQSNFYFLAAYGSVLILGTFFIQESYPEHSRKPLLVSQLCQAYLAQIKVTPFLLAVLAVSTNFCVMFAFISSSAFIYIKIYHLPVHLFGYFFALNAAGLIFGSVTLHSLENKFKSHHIIFAAAFMSLLASIMMLVALQLYPGSIWSVAIFSFIATYGGGILYPELTSRALKHTLVYTGLASSLIGAFRFTLAALIGILIGMIITVSALPLAVIMLVLNILTIIFMVFYFNF